jgi:hypothetical protein
MLKFRRGTHPSGVFSTGAIFSQLLSDKPMKTVADLVKEIQNKEVGGKVMFNIDQHGKSFTTEVTTAAMPEKAEEEKKKKNKGVAAMTMRLGKGGFSAFHMRRINRALFPVWLCLTAFLSFTSLYAEEQPKILIGGVEEVVLFPWGVKVPARIDTGASMTSLDVRDLTVRKGLAQFRLPEQHGNVLISLRVIRHCNIRSSDARERRPVVEMELCVGSRRMRVEVNLNDRSRMEYPLILGRNVLNQGFIVDSAREKILPTKCLEGGSK